MPLGCIWATGLDPADVDSEEMRLHRQAFYLGALAALRVLHDGTSWNDLLDEMETVRGWRPGGP
jgi:hypothetical protein